MCHCINLDKHRRLAQVTTWGMVNRHELIEIFIEAANHQDWNAGFNMLCDFNKVLDFDVTPDDIYKIIEWQESVDAMIGDGKCAVIACRDLVYGMSRMWQILSSGRSQKVGVFRQMNDAIIWLGSTFKE